MSVAKCLGVDDLDAPNMRELRAEWPRWRRISNDLPDVDDLKDLLDLAHAAEQIDAPGRRGRGGLMTPSVTQLVEETHAMSSRSIRRHAAGAIKAIREEAERGHPAM